MASVPGTFGTIETIGRLIFSKFLLPFEVASVLLLAAILGAVGIAKKKIW
jgi:NADH-quinone oxidoreductase subunit J